MNKVEFQNLLERLFQLKAQIGFNRELPEDEYLKHLHKHFSEREILILKEGTDIPDNYNSEHYKD